MIPERWNDGKPVKEHNREVIIPFTLGLTVNVLKTVV